MTDNNYNMIDKQLTFYEKYIKPNRNKESYNAYMRDYYYKKRGLEVPTREEVVINNTKKNLTRRINKIKEEFKDYGFNVNFIKIE